MYISHGSWIPCSSWWKLGRCGLLQLPQKLKQFCWCLLKLYLPTRFNLHCRGVSCPTICVLCDDAVEDDMHLFFGCAHFRDCWVATNLWSKIEQKLLSFHVLPELFFSIFAGIWNKKKSRFVPLLWSIWHARNEVLREHKTLNVSATCRAATDAVQHSSRSYIYTTTLSIFGETCSKLD